MEFSENIEQMLRQTINSIMRDAAYSVKGTSTSFCDIVTNTKKTINELGCRVLEQIVYEIERCYEAGRDKHRVVVRNRNKSRTFLTEFGSITFNHTLYFDKNVNKYFFAVDELLQLEKYSRIEQNLQAKLVADATLTSFGKASALSGNTVSRQTVYNLVKQLKTIDAPTPDTERDIKEIYIEADEDHIHLNDGSAAEMKLVYVHEGRENTNKRTALKNPRYFVSAQSDSDTLWNDVADYLLTKYQPYRAKVHLSGDGAYWIKAGTNIMPHVEYHLDKFHVQKALVNISHGDKKVQTNLRKEIYSGKKTEFLSTSKSVYDHIDDSKLRRTIRESVLYIKGNFPYIHRENKCSAEGHVSHILSAQMSSRPMGWSLDGAERIAKLRAYMYNGGDFLELIRKGKSAPVLCDEISQRRFVHQKTHLDGIVGIDELHTYAVSGISNCGTQYAQNIKQILNN